MDILLKEEINKVEEDSNDFMEDDLRIQASKEEGVEAPLEEAEENNLLLLEEKKAITITMIRDIFSLIDAINFSIITLNSETKL